MFAILASGACGGKAAAPAAPAEPAAAAAPAAEPAPAAAAAPSAGAADSLRAAVDAPGRPEKDRARDADRKPYETMQFFGIAPGMKVAELGTVGGYYAELVARAVGPQGHFYGQNTPAIEQKFAEPELDTRLKQPELANITKLVTPFEDPGLPAGQLDAVLMIQIYHDTFWLNVNRKQMNAAIFSALKPGGVFGIIDHSSAPGTGSTQTKTLHRVEKDAVVKEVVAADDHSKNVFDPSIRGKTDQFMIRFRKPK